VKYGSIKLNPSGAHVHSSSTLALRLLPTEIPSSSPVSGRQHTQRDSFLLENVLRLEKQKREERISKQFSILVLGFFPFFKVSNSFHIGLLKAHAVFTFFTLHASAGVRGSLPTIHFAYGGLAYLIPLVSNKNNLFPFDIEICN
jgi:hypothetical protein